MRPIAFGGQTATPPLAPTFFQPFAFCAGFGFPGLPFLRFFYAEAPSLDAFFAFGALRCNSYSFFRLSSPWELLMDILCIAGIAAFWALAAALVVGCDKLRRAPGGRP